MSQKRQKKSEVGRVAKRQRVVMTLEQKLEILNKIRGGMNNSEVARQYRLNESTVRSIRQNEKAIRDSVKTGTSLSLKVTCFPRDRNLEKTEHVLNLWIKEQLSKGVFAELNTISIRNHAKKLYRYFAVEENSVPFVASKGWFENFKRRYNLYNLKAVTELLSADQSESVTLSSGEDAITDDHKYPTPTSKKNGNEDDFSASHLSLEEFAASICHAELEKIESEIDSLSDKDSSSGNENQSSRLLLNDENASKKISKSLASKKLTSKEKHVLGAEGNLSAQASSIGKRKCTPSKILRLEDGGTKSVPSLENLRAFLAKAKELTEVATNIDPSKRRSLKFKKSLDGIVQPYKKLHQLLS